MRLLLISLLLAATLAGAQTTPKPGSAERKAMLDALRTPVEKALKGKVQFKVDWLKTQGGWAFLKGVPQRPGGARIDYAKTLYRDQVESGVFDDWICAILRRKNGKWSVLRYVIGATDVVYEPWPKEFGAPRIIFDLPPNAPRQ